MAQGLLKTVAKKWIPSKNKQQMLKKMQRAKEMGREIKNFQKEGETPKGNSAKVRFEDNMGGVGNMAKRNAQSDGETEAVGGKRSFSEKSAGGRI